jgi:hypothetical protein
MKYGLTNSNTAQIQSVENKLKTDIFAVGVILYQMISGQQLFSGETEKEVIQKNLLFNEETDLAHLENDPNLSPNVLSLLQFLLNTNLKLRPRAEQFLSHPWFSTGVPRSVSGMRARMRVPKIFLPSN